MNYNSLFEGERNITYITYIQIYITYIPYNYGMKPKIKGGSHKLFNLSEQEINLVGQLTRVGEFKSQSEFVGWLIRNYAISKNPISELEMLKEQKDKLQNQINRIEEKEKETIERAKVYEEDKKHKEKWKEKAIQIIKRKMMEGADRFEIEDIARYWSFRLNMDMKELVYYAGTELKNESNK